MFKIETTNARKKNISSLDMKHEQKKFCRTIINTLLIYNRYSIFRMNLLT